MKKIRVACETTQEGKLVGRDPSGQVYIFNREPDFEPYSGVYYDADVIHYGGFDLIVNLRDTRER